MPLRRGYLLALCVAVCALGGYYLVSWGGNGDGGPASLARQVQNLARQVRLTREGLPAARRALQGITIPGSVRLVTGCHFDRCWVVHAPPGEVAHALPRILRSVGGQPDNTPLMFTSSIQGARETGVKGCEVMRSPYHGPFTVCDYSGTLDHNTIDLFLRPYVPCRLDRCKWTPATEIDVSLPAEQPVGPTPSIGQQHLGPRPTNGQVLSELTVPHGFSRPAHCVVATSICFVSQTSYTLSPRIMAGLLGRFGLTPTPSFANLSCLPPNLSAKPPYTSCEGLASGKDVIVAFTAVSGGGHLRHLISASTQLVFTAIGSKR